VAEMQSAQTRAGVAKACLVRARLYIHVLLSVMCFDA